MTRDQVENFAVSVVQTEINKYKELKPGISSGDKKISWDGYITVFDGRGRKRENFEYEIFVQVKGRTVKKINKVSNYLYIEKVHLENYQKQKNGTLLLVVDIVSTSNFQIFYANLLPVDLDYYLNKNEDKTEKSKISIPLKPIEDVPNFSLKNVCQNFALNSKEQLGIPIKDLSELKNIDRVEFTVIAEKEKAFEYMLNSDTYTYAILDDGLKSKIALPKGELVVVQNEVNGNIKVGNRVFYSSYIVTKEKDKELIIIGRGIFFYINNNKIRFRFQGPLKDRITDMTFFVNLLKNRKLTINGVNLPLLKIDDSKNTMLIDEYNQRINDLEKLNNKFEELQISFNEDIEKLEKQDFNNLLLFKNIFCDNTIPKNWNIEKTGIYWIKIGKCYIAVFIQKNNDSIKVYNYFDKLDDIISIVATFDEKESKIEARTSPYLFLKKDEILKFNNFNAKTIKESLELVKDLKVQAILVNEFVLELLKAYDQENNRKDLLNLAEYINNKLLKQDNSVYNELNKFQIIKRKREFTDKEKEIILELRENIDKNDFFNQNQCGIAILLDNYNDYLYYYQKLNADEKCVFDSFPIKNLLDKYFND